MHLPPRASLFSNGHSDHVCNHNIGLLALHLWPHAEELRLMELAVCAAKGRKKSMANENSKMMLLPFDLFLATRLRFQCLLLFGRLEVDYNA